MRPETASGRSALRKEIAQCVGCGGALRVGVATAASIPRGAAQQAMHGTLRRSSAEMQGKRGDGGGALPGRCGGAATEARAAGRRGAARGAAPPPAPAPGRTAPCCGRPATWCPAAPHISIASDRRRRCLVLAARLLGRALSTPSGQLPGLMDFVAHFQESLRGSVVRLL